MVSMLSLGYLLYTVVLIMIFGVPFAGYGTIVSLIVMLFGILFFVLGILGQYLAQIYEEVKARPNFVVTRKIGIKDTDEHSVDKV
ncbi:MAG: Undecaprenyl-phosphate 4-deoxy-4-formamido-L-arabinose transferase [Syntrophorhabdus sp. PtaU1.Bin153]|nr:MAG: Undecaprenyl-phosphate 4-deoxy-4-formamido-L-arabinose transferase [Syntrophorhabdus sp. PtaU1.Bin153]